MPEVFETTPGATQPASSAPPSTAAPSTPPPAAAPSTPAPSTSVPAVQTPSQPTSAAPTPQTTSPGAGQQAPAATASNIRELLNQHLGGTLNLSAYTDDAGLLRAVAQTIRDTQAQQQFAQIGQQILPDMAQYQQWKKDQEAAAAAKKAADQKWWSAPPWERGWLDGVMNDPVTGQVVARPGYAPDLPQKIAAFRAFQGQKLEEFFQDPIAMLKPGLEQMMREIAGKETQQSVAQVEMRQMGVQYVEQNAHWMFEHDQQNRRLTGQDGRGVLSVAGQMFKGHYERMQKMGMPDGMECFEMCKSLTHADLIRQAAAGNQPPAAAAAAAAPAPAPAAGANRLQNLDSTAAANSVGIPRAKRRPLRQSLADAFTAAGITEIK